MATEVFRPTAAHRWGAALDVWWGRRLELRGVPRPAGVRLVTVGDAVLRYSDTAPGADDAGRELPLVVLFVDPPVTVESYAELIGLLRSTHRVVVAEFPGFGFSTPRSGYDFRFGAVNELMAEFVAGLAGNHTTSHTTLVAPCASAYCGLDIATRRPGLVDRLVLSQAPSWAAELAWRDARDRQTKGLLRKPLLGQVVLRAVRTDRGRQWLRSVCRTPEVRDRLLADYETAARAGAGFGLATVFQQYLVGPAPRVDVAATEVVALWGDADPTHRRSDPAGITSLAPAARVVRLPGVGHFPELERPDVLARLVHADGGKADR